MTTPPAPGPQGEVDNDATQAPKAVAAASAPDPEPQGGDGNGATYALKAVTTTPSPDPQGSDNDADTPALSLANEIPIFAVSNGFPIPSALARALLRSPALRALPGPHSRASPFSRAVSARLSSLFYALPVYVPWSLV